MEFAEPSAVFVFRVPFELNTEAPGPSATSVNFYPTYMASQTVRIHQTPLSIVLLEEVTGSQHFMEPARHLSIS
jgi:hypothetical protein